MLILGLDGGATKTNCIIINEKYEIIGIGSSGPCNYHAVGIENAKKNIEEAIRNALKNTKYEKEKIDIAGLGIGGANTNKDYEIISDIIKSIGLIEKYKIVNDVNVAYYACSKGKPGIVTVAGTGSIVYGRNSIGKECYSGGWGWLIGDEGSAFDIARKAIQEATRAFDGRGRKTILVDLLIKELNLKDFNEIIDYVYSKVESHRIARLAPIVTKAAIKGDKIAKNILNNAAEELILAAKTVYKKLRMEKEDKVIVGGVGGVFNSNIIWRKYKSSMKELPNVYVHPLLKGHQPAIGGIILALKEIIGGYNKKLIDKLFKKVEEINLSKK
ncbi:MAG: BadF/BadG/BcrA/BcrD ATPase family protein [Nitrososphaerota archaeon]